MKPLLPLSASLFLVLTGCSHLGPKTIAVDRFDYSTAIADSWKQQTLLNIVKLRYMDLPVFVDVASIVSGYSIQTGVSVNGTLSSQNAIQGNYVAAGGQAIYTDRSPRSPAQWAPPSSPSTGPRRSPPSNANPEAGGLGQARSGQA